MAEPKNKLFIDKKRFDEAFKLSGLESYQLICEAANVSPSSFSKWHSGENSVDQSKLEIIARLLYCGPLWLVNLSDDQHSHIKNIDTSLLDLLSNTQKPLSDAIKLVVDATNNGDSEIFSPAKQILDIQMQRAMAKNKSHNYEPPHET